MTKQEYLKTISKLSNEVLAEELDLVVDICIKGCLECPHKFDDSQCKLDVIREIIKERI